MSAHATQARCPSCTNLGINGFTIFSTDEKGGKGLISKYEDFSKENDINDTVIDVLMRGGVSFTFYSEPPTVELGARNWNNKNTTFKVLKFNNGSAELVCEDSDLRSITVKCSDCWAREYDKTNGNTTCDCLRTVFKAYF